MSLKPRRKFFKQKTRITCVFFFFDKFCAFFPAKDWKVFGKKNSRENQFKKNFVDF